MDESLEKWISSLEMGDENSCDQDSYMKLFDADNFLIDFDQPSFSFEDVISNSTMQCNNNSSNIVEKTTYDDNMIKRNDSFNPNISEDATLHKVTTTTTTTMPSQTTYILSFENSSVEPAFTTDSEIPKGKEEGSKNIRHRSSCELQGHILAERKRRQVLTERFIALSAIIPGLKKTDKAYILRETINYVKQLQERVKELEINQNKGKKGDSIIFMKKSQACTNDETNISCDSGNGFKKAILPKVDVRVLEKEILIGIHCEKQKDIVLRLMVFLQNLHLSLASSSVLPFGTSTLKVTIIAKMENEYCMSVNDLVKSLRQYLLDYSHGLQK